MKMKEKQIEAEYNAFWKRGSGHNLPWNELGKEEQDQFRMRIESTAPHVLYAQSEPKEPLTDEEWNPIAQCIRKWERDNRKPFGDIRDAINAVYAKRNVTQPVADAHTVDGDMVDQMLVCIYGPKCGGWEPELRRRMAKAARIPLDRMRGPVTPEELKHFHDVAGEGNSKMGITEWIIDRRIDRILRSKRQTPVEMVTELIEAYRGGVSKELAEKIVEELEAHYE